MKGQLTPPKKHIAINFSHNTYKMLTQGPPVSNTELGYVLGIAATIATVLYFSQQYGKKQKQVVLVNTKDLPPPPKPKAKPAMWELGGAAPGWTSGRWLGEGDFVHADHTRHPFYNQPRYAGHPFHSTREQMPQARQAPPMLGPLGSHGHPPRF